MKKSFLFLLLSFSTFSSTLFANATSNIQLKLNEKTEKQICQSPLWKDLHLFWVKSVDERPQANLGWQRFGSTSTTEVFSDKPLEEIFTKSLTSLFQKCGATFVEPGIPSAAKVTFHVLQFDSGIQKGIITGREKAQSRVAFLIEKGNQKISAQVGYEIESKRFRKKGLKQLQQSLNELFNKTLEEVFLNEQIKAL